MIKRSKYYSQRTPVLAQNCVSTQHPLATQVGINTLKKGGNAIDAALASAIALTILAPTMTSIGSDLFAIIWDGKKLHGLNASGKSPQHWSEEYFLNKYQQAMPMTGWDSVTVPGAIAGWASLSEKFGRLDFPELFEDAIMYAEKGAMVPPLISNVWNTYGPMLFSNNKEFSKLFLPGGKAPQAGSLFKSPAHANTFKKIAATRGQDFYKGELAEKIVNTAKLQDGASCNILKTSRFNSNSFVKNDM